MKTSRPLLVALTLCLAATAGCKRLKAAMSPQSCKLGELAKYSASTDKGPSGHNYVEIYERFVLQWRGDPIKIFEIGVDKGGSLLMWQDYFPKAKIFAVDIVDKSKYDTPRVKTLIGDQSKRDQLQKAIAVSGADIDLLVDDGGHTMEQQQVSLGFLFKFVKPGGYYILEDIHTSIPAWWPNYGQEPDLNNTTLRMIQNYMASDAPKWQSKYMLPEEMKYLDQHVEYVNLVHRAVSHSIVAIFKKK
jgi:cephalosporin hydroxylase